jgi:hypothetical protein
MGGAKRGETMTIRNAWIAAAVVMTLGGAVQADPDADITKDPGYVDFGEMKLFGKEETTMEILLEKDTLQLLCAFGGDTDLCDLVAKLRQIRVQSFELANGKLDDVEKATADVSKKLEDKGWTALVKVKERREGSNTYVYMKSKDKKVQGFAVMNINPREDVTFLNIVGELDPEKLGKLARGGLHGVHISGLDSLELVPKHGATKDDDKDKDKGATDKNKKQGE